MGMLDITRHHHKLSYERGILGVGGGEDALTGGGGVASLVAGGGEGDLTVGATCLGVVVVAGGGVYDLAWASAAARA